LKTKKIVITGGPSTGKSSIIEKLCEIGYQCKSEISREITMESQKKGINQLFLQNPLKFSEKVFKKRKLQFKANNNSNYPFVFFDRGLPDVIAYMDYAKENYSKKNFADCNKYKYDYVFILYPWQKIYKQDNERYETYDQCVEIHNFLVKWYKKLGYELTRVPETSVDDRVNFILSNI
tara:strand:+ start:1156 stop:1689 length:534 start_codon:yes stop_codon:yes gene_type:complete